MKGRSSLPSLCSVIGPEISGPQKEVSSKSFDQVKEANRLNPLLKRCSTFASMASYWFFPHGLELSVTSPHSGIERIRSWKLRLLAVYRPRATAGVVPSARVKWKNGFGMSSSHRNLSFGLQVGGPGGFVRQDVLLKRG